MTDSPDRLPPAEIDVYQMNRILRHKLRNLCAGFRMTLDRIAEQTAESLPHIGDRCSIMLEELKNLEGFTDRLNLVVDSLPQSEKFSLFNLLSAAREFFKKGFPFSSLKFEGPEDDPILEHGTWLLLALTELLSNAGEAAGADNEIVLRWDTAQSLTLQVCSNGRPLPPSVPTAPPQAFCTERSRHDGMGLAIVNRLCVAMDAEFTVESDPAGAVVATITLPEKEIVHE